MPITTEIPVAPDAMLSGWQETAQALNARLLDVLKPHDDLAIAVSGGIDRMTLAFVAHRFLAKPPTMVHAVSPAVPAQA
jgi:pyridinium-3,5-biscarboxylic acid mononucleotide sulfurtransferase